MTEEKLEIKVNDPAEAAQLHGNGDKNFALIEENFSVQLIARGDTFLIVGEEEAVKKAHSVVNALLELIRKGIQVNERDVVAALEMANAGTIDYFVRLYEEEIARTVKGKVIRAKSIGQRAYVKGIKNFDLTFGIGPAGTGKTYLAVVMASQALKNGHVKRIILTRPAVEAGESLGFLPGDLKEKVDPYLRPLYDALHDVIGAEQTERLIERGVIEIAPLAYMRGRTLDDAFVILDEAQNTTPAQMKMFLTRLGFGSKMVITGDKTQIDLPKNTKSGLMIAESMLKTVKGIDFHYLEQGDVVRHPLVAKIIQAYEEGQ
ncbi:phosphate starvation-inducible PhoH-like protein [Chryseomicrobium aureum]|uniref:PhoH family protein n=1 Tax=Chryseomicrobium aureum TaxID=1441723 RepID=UPI00195D6675|nr:PhoH family protein [Chryseomicrobium aureum]MBM7707739.1 phosphate starvation-inducible PhoH-like protein [Chryseomicrobium aureum]